MQIDISIVCNCYNHGRYIADAIEGFLCQEGDFSFEILINDDASTDNSQDIIRHYADKYPNIIRTWLHKQNQHSIGYPFFSKEVVPSARGRYIAYCEGDDYWVSPHKLMKQFEFMESHPDYAGCLHNCYVIDYEQDALYLSEPFGDDKDKRLNDIIVQGGGLVNPTASAFYRRACMDGFYPDRPPVGDHFKMMQVSTYGPLRWLSEPMSVYRRGVPGSDTRRTRERGVNQVRNYHERYVVCLEAVRDHLSRDMTQGEFCSTNDAFVKRINTQWQSMEAEILRIGARDGLSLMDVLTSPRVTPFSKARAVAYKYLPDSLYVRLNRTYKRIGEKRDGRLVQIGLSELPKEVEPLRIANA